MKIHEIGWDLNFLKSCNEQLRSIHWLRTHDGYIPNYLRTKFKFKSQSQINICVFFRNNGWLMENMDKMGADKLAKNIPNAPKFVCPSPKSLGFRWKKRLHWASIVRGALHKCILQFWDTCAKQDWLLGKTCLLHYKTFVFVTLQWYYIFCQIIHLCILKNYIRLYSKRP